VLTSYRCPILTVRSHIVYGRDTDPGTDLDALVRRRGDTAKTVVTERSSDLTMVDSTNGKFRQVWSECIPHTRRTTTLLSASAVDTVVIA
jgi:hypothetical protein